MQCMQKYKGVGMHFSGVIYSEAERCPNDFLWELGALHIMALLLGPLSDCSNNALFASCCNICDVIGKDFSNTLTPSGL